MQVLKRINHSKLFYCQCIFPTSFSWEFPFAQNHVIFFASVKFCGQTGNVGRESRDEGKVKGKLKKAYINGGSVSFPDSANAGRFPEYWCFRIQVAVANRFSKGLSIKLHTFPPMSSHNGF